MTAPEYIRDGLGWENNEQVPVVSAPHDELETEIVIPEFVLEAVRPILLPILDAILTPPFNTEKAEQTMGRRAFVFAHLLGHELATAKPLSSYAPELNCTKYALLKISKNMAVELGLIHRWQRGTEGRERMRQAALARKNKKADQTVGAVKSAKVETTISDEGETTR
ncbi:MAG: hypothetical protein ACK4UN_08125 [Limisphaerales bacterium]